MARHIEPTPKLDNTKRRAFMLGIESQELLQAIMVLTTMRPNRPNELYLPVRRVRRRKEQAEGGDTDA